MQQLFLSELSGAQALPVSSVCALLIVNLQNKSLKVSFCPLTFFRLGVLLATCGFGKKVISPRSRCTQHLPNVYRK